MTVRLIVCLAISILVHLLVLIQPFAIIAKPEGALIRPSAIPIRLVEISSQPQGPKDTYTPSGISKPSQNDKAQGGVSFKAEGATGAGYLDILKTRIFNVWQYPQDAIRKGEQGRVSISFVINDKGEVTDIGVLSSSGSYSLDSAAMAAIEKAAPFGAFMGDVKGKTLKVTGQFCYVLD